MNMKHVIDKDGQLLGFVDIAKYSGLKFDAPWNIPEQAKLTKYVGIEDSINTLMRVTELTPRKVEFRVGESWESSVIGLFVMEKPEDTWLWERDDFVKFEGRW